MQIHPGRKKLLGVQESIGMPGVESLTVSGISHRELYRLPGVVLVAGIGRTHLEWHYSPHVELLTSSGITDLKWDQVSRKHGW